MMECWTRINIGKALAVRPDMVFEDVVALHPKCRGNVFLTRP